MTAALIFAASTFVLGYWRGRRARRPKACLHGVAPWERCLACIADRVKAARV
jgi:hypothetical protein